MQIFKFQLHRLERSTLQQIKWDISQFKRENERLRGELKLFRYYFLHMWRERQSRFMLNQPENDALRQAVVSSTNRLWDGVSASGLILEEFGAKTYYLAFQTMDQAANQGQFDVDSSSFEGPNNEATNKFSGPNNQIDQDYHQRTSNMGTTVVNPPTPGMGVTPGMAGHTGSVAEMYEKQYHQRTSGNEVNEQKMPEQKNTLAQGGTSNLMDRI